MSVQVETELWLSPAQAARVASVHRATLHRAAVRGELPHAVTPVGRLFLLSDVIAWSENAVSGRAHDAPAATEDDSNDDR